MAEESFETIFTVEFHEKESGEKAHVKCTIVVQYIHARECVSLNQAIFCGNATKTFQVCTLA